MLISLATGLRISAEGQFATWSKALQPIIPQGQVWTLHLIASLVLVFSSVCYFIYVRRTALFDRNSAKRMRTFTQPTTRKLRWRAINVALHWFAYFAIIALTATGFALYWGYGDWFVVIHRGFAWSMLAYIAIHSLAHFMFGGLDQILRLFRPQNLVPNQFMQAWPIAIALSAALTATAAVYAIDSTTKPTLHVGKFEGSPLLDGRLDEPIWDTAQPITMRTHQGANLSGSGTSNVTVKAVHDGEKIHFAFRWQDPSRSLMRSPTVKFDDGWRVIANGSASN